LAFLPLLPFSPPLISVFAAAPEIVDYPKELDVSASGSAQIKLFVKNKKNTQYHLIAAFCEDPCHNKFGKTWVGTEWVGYGEKNKQHFYPVITDSEALWEGSVGFMPDSEDTGYKGSKEYFLKVGYYTASGKTAKWGEAVPVTIIGESLVEDKISDDIAHIRDLPLGTKIQTHGLVTVEQGPLGEDVFYIEDDFAGIKVDLPKGMSSGIALGDKVRVGCSLKESRGEKYIKVADGDSVSVLETNLACRAPSKIAAGERLDNWEGRLVQVEGEVVETSGDTFYLDDGSGKIKVYIRESTGIDKPPMSRGDTARAAGIISQWGQHKDGSDNYRLVLRYSEDLVVYPGEEEVVSELGDTVEASASGEVLGVVSVLPQTGGISLVSWFVQRIDSLYIRFVGYELNPHSNQL